MNRIGAALLVLLLLQCGLGGTLLWSERKSNLNTATRPLAPVGAYIVDEIQIEEPGKQAALLRRQGNHWLLPQLGGLPADGERVARIVTQLTTEDPSWSVAHTLPARQRFQVADYHYRRRLTLMAQQQSLSTVYLGTSPGFRKVHARNDKQDAIYSIPLNLFDVPADDAAWLDRRLLQIRTPMQITADGYSLKRDAGNWRLGSGETPDQRELDALLAALRSLQITGIAPDTVDLAAHEAALILEIDGLARSATLKLYAVGEEHFIGSSEYPQLFRLSAYDYDRLTGIDAFLLSGAQ